MIENSNYKFEVSLSREAFVDKTIANAMIQSVKVGANDDAATKTAKAARREIRTQYGFTNSNRGISFERASVSSSELLEMLAAGHTYAHLYANVTERSDGTFGSSEKRDENFEGSWLVGVDIDETSYATARDFISELTLKPTFWYTSYSNQIDGKGARFRMMYVFDEKISDKYEFRYVAWSLNSMIQHDTHEEIADDCNLRCSQYFNGTNSTAPDIVFDSDITDLIYSFSDVNASEDGYLDFLMNYCYYKSKSNNKTIDINNRINNIINNNNTNIISKCNNNQVSSCFIDCENKDISDCNPFLERDMAKLSYDEFMRQNRHKYQYFYRTEQEGWASFNYEGKCYYYQPIDENNYIQLPYYAKRQEDLMKRRKKLYSRMCLRRIIKPDVDFDTLLFCAYEDRERFFDNSDGVLSIECLKKNVESALNKDIEDLKNMYKDYISTLPCPKSGIIFKRGQFKDYSDDIILYGLQSKLIKLIHYKDIDTYYNKCLSVMENQDELKRHNIIVSKDTLYRYLHDKGVNVKVDDETILALLDHGLSIRDNVKVLKDMYGIRTSKDRIGKLLKISL